MITRCITSWLIGCLLSTTIAAQTNPELKISSGHREYVHYGAASADERLLATASSDGMIIWDLATGLELRTFKRNMRPEIPFMIPGTGDLGSVHDGVVRRYNGQTLQERTLASISQFFLVKGVAVDPFGKYVYIGAHRYDGGHSAVLYQVDLQTGNTRLIKQVTMESVGVTLERNDVTSVLEFNTLTVSPDGKTLCARLECPKGNVPVNYSFFNTQTLQAEATFHAPGDQLGFITDNLLWHIGNNMPF